MTKRGWFARLIGCSDGQPSTMRLFMLAVGTIVIGNWLFWQFWQMQYIPFPLGDSLLLGVIAASKAAQSYSERELDSRLRGNDG